VFRDKTAEAIEAASDTLDASFRLHLRRAFFAGLGALIALIVGSSLGNGIHTDALHTRLIIIALGIVFVVLGVIATRSAAGQVGRLIESRGGAAAGTTVRLMLTLIGYVIIILSLLGMYAVPLGHLLVGGAITGIVVGIAAQQSLGNIFAGLLLLLARPYVVGEEIRVNSGALGGPFDGTVIGMDLLYTTLQTDEGPIRLPNAGLLAAAVGPRPPRQEAGQDAGRTAPEQSDTTG
jgi:small-conductance mechanosensitive channel